MVFDARDYRDAQLCFPAYHHPHAAMSGPAISRVLEIAYLCARRDARTIISQTTAMDLRDPLNSMLRQTMEVTSFTRIAEGYRYIPDSTTHLVGEVIYSMLGLGDVATVSHRVVAVGAGTDTGSTVTTDVGVASSVTASASRRLRFADYSPYSPGPGVLRESFEVALSNAPAGALTNIYVEAFAVDAATDAIAQSYFLHHCRVWTEIRG